MLQNRLEVQNILGRDRLRYYVDNAIGEEAKNYVMLGVKYPSEHASTSLIPPSLSITKQAISSNKRQDRAAKINDDPADDQFAIVKAAFEEIDVHNLGYLDLQGLRNLNTILGLPVSEELLRE